MGLGVGWDERRVGGCGAGGEEEEGLGMFVGGEERKGGKDGARLGDVSGLDTVALMGGAFGVGVALMLGDLWQGKAGGIWLSRFD